MQAIIICVGAATVARGIDSMLSGAEMISAPEALARVGISGTDSAICSDDEMISSSEELEL